MVLPELSECQLCIRSYFKTPLEKDLRIEFFEVGNDLLAHGLNRGVMLGGKNFMAMKLQLNSSKSSSRPGG